MRAIVRPPRVTLANVSTGERLECLFNPTHLSERVQVSWNRLAVVGLGRQVLQYQSTGNRLLPGVEFYVDKFFASEQPGDADILAFRDFLRALTVPAAAELAPPRVLVVWPGVVTLEGVVTELEFQYRQFGSDGNVLVYAASCSFEEAS